MSSCSDDKSTSPVYDNRTYTQNELNASYAGVFDARVYVTYISNNIFAFDENSKQIQPFNDKLSFTSSMIYDSAGTQVPFTELTFNDAGFTGYYSDNDYICRINDNDDLDLHFDGTPNIYHLKSTYFGDIDQNIIYPAAIQFTSLERGEVIDFNKDLEFNWTGGGTNEFVIFNITNTDVDGSNVNLLNFEKIVKNQGKIIINKDELAGKIVSGKNYDVSAMCVNVQLIHTPLGKTIQFLTYYMNNVTVLAK